MTPDERRIYNALIARKSYHRKKNQHGQPATLVIAPQLRAGTISPEPRAPRVFAPDNQTAQDMAGPDAVAVATLKVVLPLELIERLKRTVSGLRRQGMDVDASFIIEMNLRYTLDDLEAQWNDGEKFPDLKAPPKKHNPILRAKPQIKPEPSAAN